MEALFQYGAKAWPFEVSCCEGFVEKSLHFHCFFRDDTVVGEELADPQEVRRLHEAGSAAATNLAGGAYDPMAEWQVLPSAQRLSEYSPMILNAQVTSGLGFPSCSETNKCVPAYRTRYTYIHRVMSVPWVKHGVVCVGLMGDGHLSGAFLVSAGLASHIDHDIGKNYFAPCVVIPSLTAALESTRSYLQSLPKDTYARILSGEYSD